MSDMNEFVLRIDQRIEYLECDGHGNSARDVAAFRDAAVAEITRLRAELSKAEAERNAAREDLDRTQRVLAKIDAVRTHQSEKLVRVYEASGAEPEHYDRLDIFVGVMRRLIDAVEAMGYEWRWTKSIDENGEQVGAWVMRREEGGA